MPVGVIDPQAESPAGRPVDPRRPRGRTLLVVTAVLAVVLLAAGGAAVYVRRRANTAAPVPARPRRRHLLVPTPAPKVDRVTGTPAGPGGVSLRLAPGQRADELFITGGARYFRPAGRWSRDGRWRVRVRDGNALFVTRLLVVRPTDPARFNGNVVLDWIGDEGGAAAQRAAAARRQTLVARGYAWVGVSADPAEVAALEEADPSRYRRLGHAGASYSYDIYSQAAKAIRASQGVKPLGDLRVVRLIGESDPDVTPQLLTYVNAVQQHSRQFDGFVLRNRPRGAASLSVAPQRLVAVPWPSPIRRVGGAPLRVCLGGGRVAPEPRTIVEPRLEPRTRAQVAAARAVLADLGCGTPIGRR